MQTLDKRIAELEKQATIQSIKFQLNAPWLDIKNLILRNSLAPTTALRKQCRKWKS